MVDLKKTEVVQKWPRPTSPTEIRSFLGLAGYYRRFVQDFSRIAALLTKLTQKNKIYGHIAPAKRLFAKDIQRLEGTGIRFSIGNSEALLACTQAKSSLVERIKATQYEDERLCKYRDEVLAGKSKDMIVESDGVLRMGDKLCVADVDGLRHAILKEAHNSKYTIHPGSTKIYHDLKQFYWWEASSPVFKLHRTKHCTVEDVLLDGLKLLIRQRLLAAQSRQKSYADKRRRDLVFTIGDKVFLRVSPIKGVMRFGKRGKLSPRFIGPYEIINRVEAVAYRLALPPEISFIHPVFHVSMLRKYISDSSQVLEAPTIPLDEKLSYEEEPMAIVDRQIRKLWSKEIVFVKILWRNHTVKEATWEIKDAMRVKYPHLFQFTGTYQS
uniref:Uncharacterized protein n=1 Tax=Nicotiana tabacum TaxID=4097 RepID=A0A1S4CFL3_TOBAC|nr:PREDICTED: uncharacterized protein LOC107818285 [Nicotiana tabacum]